MAVGENKSVKMCYADDEACSMSLLLAPDLVLTELKFMLLVKLNCVIGDLID